MLDVIAGQIFNKRHGTGRQYVRNIALIRWAIGVVV
jgi:hypothetical protein